MSAPSRELEDRVRWMPRLVRELVSRYVEENPEAANAADVPDHLVSHAFIAPLCRGAKQSDWIERLSWAFFERLLQEGAQSKGGVRLSPAECKLFLQVLNGERKRPAQQRRPNTRRVDEMADYLELLEANRWPPEAAVAQAQEVYSRVRATVYGAKKKRKEQAAMLELEPKGCNMTPEALRNQIELHQQQAEKWRARRKRPRR
jgi:hypothetical protein